MKIQYTLQSLFVVAMTIVSTQKSSAQQTDKVFLSGKDFEHPAQWEFYCTDGNNSKKWSTINVPSQWEL